MRSSVTSQYLITGASSDIGRELIKHLSSDPTNKILAVYRREDFDLAQTDLNANHKYLRADLTNEDNLKTLQSTTQELFDQPFTAIHCVGDFWYHRPLINTTFDDARKMIESHYLTLFGLAHSILPVQKELKGGKLIAFSCNSVGFNYPEMAAFTSAKAAVESLIKCIANEYSEYGIVANAIALSTIRTEKVEKSKDPKYFDGYITAEELAKLVLEAISELSPLVNGNVIRLLKYSKYFYHEGYFQRNKSTYISDQPSDQEK
jgi:3-oxoacyl-[acyl-carrier protein] reductase